MSDILEDLAKVVYIELPSQRLVRKESEEFWLVRNIAKVRSRLGRCMNELQMHEP